MRIAIGREGIHGDGELILMLCLETTYMLYVLWGNGDLSGPLSVKSARVFADGQI